MNTSVSAPTKVLCRFKADHHSQLLLRKGLHVSRRHTRLSRYNCFCSLQWSSDDVPRPINSSLWSKRGNKLNIVPTASKHPIEVWPAPLPVILFKAVLMLGIGLGMTAPAMAAAAPPKSEFSIEKEVEKATQNAAEKDAEKRGTTEKGHTMVVEESVEANAENKKAFGLDEAFWKELDLSKGSIILVLKGILQGDPANRDALECLAKNLVDMDDARHALMVVEKLELLEPDEMEWKYLKGFAYDLSGQFEQAKEIYQEILKAEPFSSKAIQGLMMAMDELDQTDALADVVEKTMVNARKANNYVEARNISMLIGQFYMMKGHLYDALDHYQEMLEEDSKDFRPHICLGIIYCALGEKAKAEQQFKAYEKLCPKDYAERKYLDALMRKAKREGQKRFEDKQKEKYLRFPKSEKMKPADE